MSILVTGGAGYIGSHMVHKLLNDGHRTIVLDNLSTGNFWAVPNEAVFVKGDVGNQELVEKVIKQYNVDSIIHFAGSVIVPESVVDPLGYYENNTVKSRSLIEVAINTEVKNFIFSSTAAVYGMPKSPMVSETDLTDPISPYGSSKLMTEMMLRDTSIAHDFKYIALRYFNVAGADPENKIGQATPNATHLIKVACQVSLGLRPKLSVFGNDFDTVDGTGVRDYIHVVDLVSAHYDALNYLKEGGQSQIFNCGYGHGFSVLEVIEAIKEISGVDFKVEFTKRRDGDPAALVANTTKIRAVLNWKPNYNDLNLIVRHALNWEQKLLNLAEIFPNQGSNSTDVI